MIRHLEHLSIDKEKWNDCIQGSTLPFVYALSWYLDLICPDWEALVEDDYQAVFPLTSNRKFGIFYLYQPYFTQQLGLYSKTPPSLDQLTHFLSSIPEKYGYGDISLNEANYFEQGGRSFRRRQTFHLDLKPDAEQLISGYSENHQRNLAKSEKMNVRLETDDQARRLIKLFRENRGQAFGKIKSKDFTTLNNLMDESIHLKQGQIISAFTKEGSYCAGAFFLKSFNRNIFLFSATDSQSRLNGAMFSIISQFIRDHSGSEEILDFEGSDIENLARFYKGFGAQSVPYIQYCFNKLSFPAKWFRKCP